MFEERCELCGELLHEGVCQNADCPPEYDLPGMTEVYDIQPQISSNADTYPKEAGDEMPALSSDADSWSRARRQPERNENEPNESGEAKESETWRDPNWLSASFLSIEQAAQPIDHTGTIQFEGSVAENFTAEEPQDDLGKTRLTDDENYRLIRTMLRDSDDDDNYTLAEGMDQTDSGSPKIIGERPNVSHTMRFHNPLLSHDSQPAVTPKHQDAPSFDSAHYKIVRPIGEGGSGIVFEAIQRTLNRRVAVKVLKQRKLKTGSRSRVTTKEIEKRTGRFLHEVNITAKLQHPNIIPVFDLETDKNGEVFYSMRLVDEKDDRDVQQSWAVLLRSRKNNITSESIDRDVQIFDKVCDAIRFAHSENIIHRDLKPDNVMVGNFGEVLVIDWGMSLDLAEITPNFTAGGTTTYMAPEMGQHYLKQTEVALASQALYAKLEDSRRDAFVESAIDHGYYFAAADLLQADHLDDQVYDLCRDLLRLAEDEAVLAKKINTKSDIYLLGAILYEIAVGHPPHYVPLSSCKNVEEKHHREFWLSSNHKIQRLVQIDDPLRLSLCNIALRALQQNPDDRFRSIDELKEALKEFSNQVQSMRLIAKGRAELEKARNGEGYLHLLPALESFRGAESLYAQGAEARKLRVETACEYARRADGRKDFEAGLSILQEYAPGENSAVTTLTDRLQAGKRKQARHRQLAAVGWTTAIVLPVIVWGAMWLSTQQLREEYAKVSKDKTQAESALKLADGERVKTQQQNAELDQALVVKGAELTRAEQVLQASQTDLENKKQELVQRENELSNVMSDLDLSNHSLDEVNRDLVKVKMDVVETQNEIEQLRFASARSQFNSLILPIPLDLRRGQLEISKRRLENLQQGPLPTMLKNVWIASHFAKSVHVSGWETRVSEQGSILSVLPWNDEHLIAIGLERNRPQLWSIELRSGKSNLLDAELPPYGTISDASVSSDGRWLALALDNVSDGSSFNEAVWLVNLKTGKRVGLPAEAERNDQVMGSRAVGFLASSTDELRLISVEELTAYRGLKKRLQITTRQFQINAEALHASTQQTDAIAATTRDDGRVNYLAAMQFNTATPTVAIAYQSLDSAGADQIVLASCRLMPNRLTESQEEAEFREATSPVQQMPLAIAVAANGELYAGFADGHLDHYQIDETKLDWIKAINEHESPIIALAAAPNGRLVAASDDGVMIVLERDLQVIKRLVGQPDELTSIAVFELKSAEAQVEDYSGFWLASGGSRGHIRCWEPEGPRHDASIQKLADRTTSNSVRLGGDNNVTCGAIDKSRAAGSVPAAAYGTSDGQVVYFNSTAMQSQKSFQEIGIEPATGSVSQKIEAPPGSFDSAFSNFDSFGIVDDWFVLMQSDGILYSTRIDTRSQAPSSEVQLAIATDALPVVSRYVPIIATAPGQSNFFSNNPVDDQALLLWRRSAGSRSFLSENIVFPSKEKGRIKKLRYSPDGRWLAVIREIGQIQTTGQYQVELLRVDVDPTGTAKLTQSTVTNRYRVGDPAFVEFSGNSRELIFHFHKLGVDRETWLERWQIENDRWVASNEKRRLDERLVNLVAWDGDRTLISKVNRLFFLTSLNGADTVEPKTLQFKDPEHNQRRVQSVQSIGSTRDHYVLFSDSLEKFGSELSKPDGGLTTVKTNLEFEQAREVRVFGDHAVVFDRRGFHLIDSDLNYVTLIARDRVAVEALDLARDRLAASYDIGGLCRVFDVSVEPIRELGRFNHATEVQLSPEGRWAACRSENEVRIYDLGGTFEAPHFVLPMKAEHWIARWIGSDTPRLLVGIQSEDGRKMDWQEIDPQTNELGQSEISLPRDLGESDRMLDFQLAPLTQKYLTLTTERDSQTKVSLWSLSQDTGPRQMLEREGFDSASLRPIAVSFSEIDQVDEGAIGTQVNILSQRSDSIESLSNVNSRSFAFLDQNVREGIDELAQTKHQFQVFEIEGVIDVVDGRQLIDARFSGDGKSLLEVDSKGIKILLSAQ